MEIHGGRKFLLDWSLRHWSLLKLLRLSNIPHKVSDETAMAGEGQQVNLHVFKPDGGVYAITFKGELWYCPASDRGGKGIGSLLSYLFKSFPVVPLSADISGVPTQTAIRRLVTLRSSLSMPMSSAAENTHTCLP